ncbi:hypothetical protein AOLI_G00136290 [Acnodon oligacanthus]
MEEHGSQDNLTKETTKSHLFSKTPACVQISAEFHRITTVHLECKFMSTLHLYTPKLLTPFRARGGALGVRLKKQMEQLKESQYSIENTRGGNSVPDGIPWRTWGRPHQRIQGP